VAGLPLMRGGPGTATPGRIRYSNVTLMGLIVKAYEVYSDQVQGPGWLTEDPYAIDAIVPPGATLEQFRQMLRNLLVKRFKLAVQWEEKDFKVYRLLIASDGPKLQESAVVEPGGDNEDPLMARVGAMKAPLDSRGCPVLPPTSRNAIGRNNCMTFVGFSIPDLVWRLEMLVGTETGAHSSAHIIDATGLTGRFDFKLDYDHGYHVMMNMPSVPPNIIRSSNTISIFKAVEEQLGLRLEPVTSKLKVMVIQHVERTPTEN